MSVRRDLIAAAAAIAALAAGGGVAQAKPTPVSVTVQLHAVTGAVNRALSGFDFHFGGPAPQTIRPLRPHFMRVDASLEQASPSPGVLNLAPLQARVQAIRAVGGTPFVILDYTPAWLGQAVAPLGDKTKTEPSDLARWRALIERVALALATGPGRVRWFEAWNEPDLPTFWAGTPTGFLDTAAASAHGVHDAAAQSGLALHFGGPASFFPDGAQISSFVSRLRSEGLPPAFVSWHYYANYPCLGPDGPEDPGSPGSVALQRALGCTNPLASPTYYTTGLGVVRSSIAGAGAGGPSPLLVLDEWNLSAGGLDLRMNTNVGAAFDAATLITFQLDQLGAAAFYEATDTDGRAGGWGTVSLAGQRRPSWWAFRLWRELAGRTVAVNGADPNAGFWALASRDRRARLRRITVLLASFSASSPVARTVTVRLVGLPRPPSRRRAAWRVTIERIDAQHSGAEGPRRIGFNRDGTLSVTLPAQAVALITLDRGRVLAH